MTEAVSFEFLADLFQERYRALRGDNDVDVRQTDDFKENLALSKQMMVVLSPVVDALDHHLIREPAPASPVDPSADRRNRASSSHIADRQQ